MVALSACSSSFTSVKSPGIPNTFEITAELVAESAGLSVGTSAGSEDELAAVLDVVADPAAV